LNSDEKKRLDESYKAYIMGLIFGLFDVVNDINNDTGDRIAIYKYTRQEGITVTRTEQLGIESRLINRLFEEQGRDTLRYEIIKKAEKIQGELIAKNKLAEMLVIFEYYYENIFRLEEFEISGEAKKKKETYQYQIVRNFAKDIENKIPPNEKDGFIKKVIDLKNNLDSFSYLCGDGMKRILKIDSMLTDSKKQEKETAKAGDEKISIDKLKELKNALELGLITEEEYKKAKEKFLN
jgi:hypothetical protein